MTLPIMCQKERRVLESDIFLVVMRAYKKRAELLKKQTKTKTTPTCLQHFVNMNLGSLPCFDFLVY